MNNKKIKEQITVADMVEFGGLILSLGKRVVGVTSVRVLQGRCKRSVLKAGIIAFDLTQDDLFSHGLIYIEDFGGSGHKVYVIG